MYLYTCTQAIEIHGQAHPQRLGWASFRMSTDADKDKLHLAAKLPLAQLDTFHIIPSISDLFRVFLHTTFLFSSSCTCFVCIFKTASLLEQKLHGFGLRLHSGAERPSAFFFPAAPPSTI